MTKMSKEAADALINAHPREGALIAHNTPAVTVAELRGLGYIGFNLGITRAGLIARGREMTRRIEDAF